MFAKKSFTLAFVAFTCAAFAFNPLAFFHGLNLALDLQDNKIINQCVYRFIMNDNAESHTTHLACYEALEIYTRAFFALAHADTQEKSTEVLTLQTLDSTIVALEHIGNENNFKAGQGVAEVVKQLASIFGMIVHERFSSSDEILINGTALFLGLNDQLQFSSDESLTDCFADSTQVETLVRALVIALEHKELSQSIEDIATIIKYFPGVKSTCASIVQGVVDAAVPLEKALKSDPKGFWKDVRANIIGNPFVVGGEAVNIVQQLKNGNDYKAGVGLGKLLQALFYGIN